MENCVTMEYLHECKKCGEFVSKKQEGETCPKCGRAARRLYISATHFHPSKGSGAQSATR